MNYEPQVPESLEQSLSENTQRILHDKQYIDSVIENTRQYDVRDEDIKEYLAHSSVVANKLGVLKERLSREKKVPTLLDKLKGFHERLFHDQVEEEGLNKEYSQAVSALAVVRKEGTEALQAGGKIVHTLQRYVTDNEQSLLGYKQQTLEVKDHVTTLGVALEDLEARLDAGEGTLQERAMMREQVKELQRRYENAADAYELIGDHTMKLDAFINRAHGYLQHLQVTMHELRSVVNEAEITLESEHTFKALEQLPDVGLATMRIRESIRSFTQIMHDRDDVYMNMLETQTQHYQPATPEELSDAEHLSRFAKGTQDAKKVLRQRRAEKFAAISKLIES